MNELEFVDGHHHYWDLSNDYPWLRGDPPAPFRYGDTRPLRRNHLPADYARDSKGFRMAAAVHIEAEWNPADPVGETRWLHEVLADDPIPHVLVAHAWLDRPDAEEVLAAQAVFPRVRGIRHKPRAAPSPERVERGAPGSMGDPLWRRGYALLHKFGLSFDLQTPWWHLEEAAELARAFPDTPVILNHTGLPADRSAEGLASWRKAMRAMAECPNAAVKISGLGVPGQAWTAELQRQVVLDTIALFGVERCMFASNWPVDSLVADFATIVRGFREIVSDLSAAEQDALFRGNAMRIYRIA